VTPRQPPRDRARPTQFDIARRAGVSQATVSLVVNGASADGQVSALNRQRVLDAISELGYTPNLSARSLRGKGTQLLGLYTFETVFPVDQRDFYYPFLLGVEAEAAQLGYDLLLFSSAGLAGERSIYAGGVNRLRKADGCVLLGRHLARDELVRLAQEDFPFVFIGRRDAGGVAFSHVAADYASATRRIVLELAELGHSRILLLHPDDRGEPGADREKGYRSGMGEAGLSPDEGLIRAVEATDVTPQALRGWMADGVTAILVEPTEQHRIARALEQAAADAGIRIPRDLSVAALGDLPQPSALSWTSFAIPHEEMGRQAVRMLVELLSDPGTAARTSILPCPPIPGDSIARAPHPL
jgi:DNA-binding LacI/PurR family transcriptional regulator